MLVPQLFFGSLFSTKAINMCVNQFCWTEQNKRTYSYIHKVQSHRHFCDSLYAEHSVDTHTNMNTVFIIFMEISSFHKRNFAWFFLHSSYNTKPNTQRQMLDSSIYFMFQNAWQMENCHKCTVIDVELFSAFSHSFAKSSCEMNIFGAKYRWINRVKSKPELRDLAYIIALYHIIIYVSLISTKLEYLLELCVCVCVFMRVCLLILRTLWAKKDSTNQFTHIICMQYARCTVYSVHMVYNVKYFEYFSLQPLRGPSLCAWTLLRLRQQYRLRMNWMSKSNANMQASLQEFYLYIHTCHE